MERIDYSTYRKPSDFIKLEEGENVIRIISSGALATIYGMRAEGRWIRFGEKIPEKTKLKYGDSISGLTRWMWIAINRTYGVVGLLEVGPMIGDAICEIAKNDQVDPRTIDLVISRSGQGQRTQYTVARATETKELTEKEGKLMNEKERLINKFFTKKS